MPILRYVVGSAAADGVPAGDVRLLAPAEASPAPVGGSLDLAWRDAQRAALYRVEVQTIAGELVVAALVQPGTGAYRLPPWVKEKAPDKRLRWRVVTLDVTGRATGSTAWRLITLGGQP